MTSIVTPPETEVKVNVKRRYKHDCDYCVFLGQYDVYDLYFCPHNFKPEIGIRSGNSEYEVWYSSAMNPKDHIYKKALDKAIEMGLTKQDWLNSLDRDDIPHYTEKINSKLTQFIRDEKGRKCGIIRAVRIDPDYFNYFVVNDEENKITEPFVIIVHSKVRKNCGDIFNEEEGYTIIHSKIDYVNDCIANKTLRRIKPSYHKPVRDTRELYSYMERRAVKYFRTDKIYKYYDFFKYNEAVERDENYEMLLAIAKDENINMKNLKLLLEGLIEDVENV